MKWKIGNNDRTYSDIQQRHTVAQGRKILRIHQRKTLGLFQIRKNRTTYGVTKE